MNLRSDKKEGQKVEEEGGEDRYNNYILYMEMRKRVMIEKGQ